MSFVVTPYNLYLLLYLLCKPVKVKNFLQTELSWQTKVITVELSIHNVQPLYEK